MTELLQVGQFAIVDHEPVDRGPNAGVFHGKGPADDRAELYMVAEGTTPAGDAFTGHVVSSVGHSWATLDVSLTGALREVFKVAERNLADWNRKSIAQHRVGLGISCFGRRGGQAVLGQAGPSIAFHLSGGNVEIHAPEGAHATPIGEGPLQPVFTRLNFAPGDRLLLISTDLLTEVDEDLVGEILALPGLRALQDLYQRVRHLRHVTALLVAVPEEDLGAEAAADDLVIDATAGPGTPVITAQAAQVPEAPNIAYQPSLFIGDDAQATLFAVKRQLQEVTPRRRVEALLPQIEEEVPQPLRRAAGESEMLRETRERSALTRATNSAGAGALVMGRRGAAAGDPTAGPAGVANDRRRRQSFSRSLVREELPAMPSHAAAEAPLVDELAAEFRPRPNLTPAADETIAGHNAMPMSAGGSLVRVRDGFGGRWHGRRGVAGGRTTGGGGHFPTWVIAVVGVVVLLTVVGLLVVPRMLQEQSSKHYADLIDGAQQRLATARVQQDATERRKALAQAQAMLLEAKQSDTPSPEVQQLMADVTAAIAQMDAIRSPASVETIASLEQFGDKPLAIARLTIGDAEAYILDSTAGQVIAVTLANGNKKVVYAEDKDARRARPVATAFLEGNDFGPALLIADTARNLWSYAPTNGLKPLLFSAPNNMAVTDMAVSGRDLYVLDSSQSTIFKFAGGDGGFLNAPAKVVEAQELASARRLVVDGDLITSDANGTVRRYSGQLALELSEAGIDRRLVSPEPALPLAKNGDLAILDAPNDRVVVLRRDGAFDRQYRHKELQQMSALAVRNGVGYVFAGGKLKRIAW